MSPALFAIATLMVGAVSLFAAAAWLRACGYAGLVAAMLALWWVALGHPRPALFGVPHGTVAGYALDEPRAIDVQVRPPGGGAPVTWALPWSEQTAAQLEAAAAEAKKMGQPLAIRGRRGGGPGFETKHHAGPVFYPAAARQLPAKQRP
ncbi:MAG: hypothetical protein ACREU2_17625 [Steroidobacteraceae bacterium]